MTSLDPSRHHSDMPRLICLLAATIFCVPLALLAETPRGKTADVNGVQIYYEEQGSGEPLVLLHGFFQSTQAWDDLAPEFAEKFRVIVMDLRGHGRSSFPQGQFRHGDAAEDVFGVLDHLGIDQFSAVGFSSGGMTLLHMATQQPARVRAMVLDGAQTYFSDSDRSIKIAMPLEPPNQREWEELRRYRQDDDERILNLRRQFIVMAEDYDDMSFTPARLGQITARTLVVQGERDPYCPISMAVEMYESIPNANLWIVPNGGHGVHLQFKNQFAKTALEFLSDGWQ